MMMDTNNCKFIKNISWEQGDQLFLETPKMILDHNHHQINTNIYPFEHSTQPNNNLFHNHHDYNNIYPNPTSSKGISLASSSSILGGNSYQTCEAKINHSEEHEDAPLYLAPMKEMVFTIASMQPVDIDEAIIKKPKRRNVRISNDPHTVAARQRRERISEKIRILQCLVPGGTKMDIASMLDEAICYIKFLKRQIHFLQTNHSPPQQQLPGTGSFLDHAASVREEGSKEDEIAFRQI